MACRSASWRTAPLPRANTPVTLCHSLLVTPRAYDDRRLINDNPYVAQVYGGSGLATSPLTRPRALERTVELFSFAKSYQMVRFRAPDAC